MGDFFLITVIGGFLKFFYAIQKDEAELIDLIALAYSVLVLIGAIIYYFVEGVNLFTT